MIWQITQEHTATKCGTFKIVTNMLLINVQYVDVYMCKIYLTQVFHELLAQM